MGPRDLVAILRDELLATIARHIESIRRSCR